MNAITISMTIGVILLGIIWFFFWMNTKRKDRKLIQQIESGVIDLKSPPLSLIEEIRKREKEVEYEQAIEGDSDPRRQFYSSLGGREQDIKTAVGSLSATGKPEERRDVQVSHDPQPRKDRKRIKLTK